MVSMQRKAAPRRPLRLPRLLIWPTVLMTMFLRACCSFAPPPPPPPRAMSTVVRRFSPLAVPSMGDRRTVASFGTPGTSTALFMGGLNKKKNKQGDLARKMALAKRQKLQKTAGAGGDDEGGIDGGGDGAKDPFAGMSDEEIKRANDMKRFEDLLNSEAATVGTVDQLGGNAYLTKEQEEEELASGYSVDKIYEGDPAKSEPFENLIHYQSQNGLPLGQKGVQRILPWTKPRHKGKYVVVVSDPRMKSAELRGLMKEFQTSLPSTILDRLIVVNADPPLENRKFLRKNDIEGIEVYSDEKREWMREYTALGDKRWTMSLFVLGEGKVQKLVRELDPVLASKVVINAVKSLTI